MVIELAGPLLPSGNNQFSSVVLVKALNDPDIRPGAVEPAAKAPFKFQLLNLVRDEAPVVENRVQMEAGQLANRQEHLLKDVAGDPPFLGRQVLWVMEWREIGSDSKIAKPG